MAGPPRHPAACAPVRSRRIRRDTRGGTRRRRRRLATTDPATGWHGVAATDDGLFVGMANGGPAPDHPEFAAVYGMWVAPEARGQGIGGALLDAVEGWARETGYDRIGLGVTTTNEPAIRLYAGHGYADLGQQLPLRDGTDLVIQLMGKPL